MNQNVLSHVGRTALAPPCGSAALSVLFVHGINGDAYGTWSTGGEQSWMHWLAEDHARINVYTAGYDSSFFGDFLKGGGPSLGDRAGILLDALASANPKIENLVIVAYSLGGLVVKQMLRRAADSPNPKHKALLDSVRGVIFIATPHMGTQIAKSLGAIAGVAASKSLIELKGGSEALLELSEWYRNWAPAKGIVTHAYYEVRKTKSVMVVDKGSADPCVSGCSPVPVDADHEVICKPASRQAQIYASVSSVISDMVAGTSLAQGVKGLARKADLPLAVTPEPEAESRAELQSDLEYYTTPAPDDRRSLADKLQQSGRAHETRNAARQKERFAMAIQRRISQPAALKNLIKVMGEVEARFSRHASLAIANGEDIDAVNAVVETKVVAAALRACTKHDGTLTSADVEQALWYLTGNCHLQWDKSA
jgi:pimeloyl-ACP methyl ester carboxylesterase